MADAGGREVGRISIRVVPNTDGFRRRVRDEVERVERSESADIRVLPDLDGFRQRVSVATRDLEATVRLRVDRSSIDQLINDLPGRPGGSTAALGGGGDITQVLKLGAIAAAVLAAAAPAVGLVTTALLALPGVLAAIAAPVSAIALGMDGIKKAAERLKDPFDDLKSAMSDVNMRMFTPVFDTLGKVIPKLKNGLPAVSQGMAAMAQAFADTVTSEEGLTRIQNMLMNISSGLLTASPGVASFTDAFMTLAEKLTSKLPKIGQWFSDIGSQFSTWVDKISADGRLDAAFNGLGSTIAWIVDVLGDLGAIGVDFFSDPGRVDAFKLSLSGVRDMLVMVMNASMALWDGLASMLSAVTTGFIGFAGTVGGLLEKLSWVPMFGEKYKGIGESLKEAAGDAIKFKAELEASKQSAQNLRDALNAPPSGGGLLGSGGIGGAAGTSIKPVAVPPPNVDQFKAVVKQLPQLLGMAGDESGAKAAEIPGKVGQALSGMGGIGSSAGAALMSGLTAGMQSGEGGLLAYVSTIAKKIAANKGPLPYDRTVLIPNGQALMEGLGTGLRSGFSGVLDDVEGMADEVKDAMNPGDLGSKVMDVGYNFATATADQAMSDLGIGGGAITGLGKALADYGMSMAKNAAKQGVTINVSNIDDALAARQRELNRQAMQWAK